MTLPWPNFAHGDRGISAKPRGAARFLSDLHMCRVGDGLAGWAYRTRTAESGREPPNWICVTISPEVGASPAAETSRTSCVASYGRAFTNRVPGDGDSRPSDLTEVALADP